MHNPAPYVTTLLRPPSFCNSSLDVVLDDCNDPLEGRHILAHFKVSARRQAGTGRRFISAFPLFSKSGFTKTMLELAKREKDIYSTKINLSSSS